MGKDEIRNYLITGIKEGLEKCNDQELLFLIRNLLLSTTDQK